MPCVHIIYAPDAPPACVAGQAGEAGEGAGWVPTYMWGPPVSPFFFYPFCYPEIVYLSCKLGKIVEKYRKILKMETKFC